jgi:hypothetical protein
VGSTIVFDRVEPEVGRFYSLIPWETPIRSLSYTMPSRNRTARQVVTSALYTALSDNQITLDAATRGRVTDGHILFHLGTKTRLILDEVNTTTGVATIRTKQYAPGGSATNIASGQTLYVIGHSEHYDEINAESRFETTAETSNHIQDITEMLDFSVAELRELRKWGVDEKLRIDERLEDIMKDLDLGLIYNVPLASQAGQSAVTGGFDYMVENAGGVINAAISGTPNVNDLRAVARTLEARGVGASAGVVMVGKPEVFYEYEDQGLTDFTSEISPEDKIFIGNSVQGIVGGSIGRIPFYTDSAIPDTRVRFVATRYASKAPYQGLGGGAPVENLRIVDEPSMSNSKVKKSTIQMKFGTKWRNADKVNAILETGIVL